MTLIPRSLFWRLALLLLAVVAIALAATILFFRHDRATLLARAFSDTKIVQLQAVRAALESSDASERRETVARIGREYGVRIMPERERPLLGAGAPVLPAMQELEARLRDRLGPGTQVRAAPGRGLLFVRVDAGDAGYWIGFPLTPHGPAEDEPSRAVIWSLSLAAVLLAAAFLFARYLARPLRELDRRRRTRRTRRDAAAAARARPLRDRQPQSRLQSDDGEPAPARSRTARCCWPASRTTCARRSRACASGWKWARATMQCAREWSTTSRRWTGSSASSSISRGATTKRRSSRTIPTRSSRACVERYARDGHATCASRRERCRPSPLRPTALSRLVANLIDNALAYGAPPVEVSTSLADRHVVLDVADRGPGIAPDQVERLKQPFTRASAARTAANGVAGAGLGLAIVDRIARMHGGTFDLLRARRRRHDRAGALPSHVANGAARATANGSAFERRRSASAGNGRIATSSTVASAAMPSPRPAKPSRSVVVALTLTCPTSHARSAAMLARIAGTCGASFGACAITVVSTFSIAPTFSLHQRRRRDATASGCRRPSSADRCRESARRDRPARARPGSRRRSRAAAHRRPNGRRGRGLRNRHAAEDELAPATSAWTSKPLPMRIVMRHALLRRENRRSRARGRPDT